MAFHYPPFQGYYSYHDFLHSTGSSEMPPQAHSQVSTRTTSNASTDDPGPDPESVPSYTYYVRMINPKKKSDFIVRTWHDESVQFKSPSELKFKLMDSFPDDVPSTSNFQVGYFEPPGNTIKRWIVDKRDLSAMYELFHSCAKINLWCERKTCEEPPKKKRKTKENECFEEDIDAIFHQLKEKNPKVDSPKLRLWAKLIQTGKHDSYETPPPIPLFSDATPSKPKKASLAESVNGAAAAVTGAASAIVNVLQPSQPNKSKPNESAQSDGTTISPLKVASLRRSCLEDLKKLKGLLEDGVLTATEFNNEKQQILRALKKIHS